MTHFALPVVTKSREPYFDFRCYFDRNCHNFNSDDKPLVLLSFLRSVPFGLFLFPLLRAFGVVRGLDEREKAIDNLSSNIALAIVFVLAMFYIGKGYEIGIDGYISFILIPFTAKAFFSLVFHFAENRRFRSKEEVSV